jgi:hypothetical protein
MMMGGQHHTLAALPLGPTLYNLICIGGWVGPRADLGVCEKSCPPLGFSPQTVQPIATGYTIHVTPKY